MAEQRQDDRQLERDAEGEDQCHDQREIFADLWQQLDRRLAGQLTCCSDTENRISSGITPK